MTGGDRGNPNHAPAAKPEPDGEALPSARELANVGLDPYALAAGLTVQFTKGSFGDLSVCDTFEAMLDLAKAKGKDSQAGQRAMLIGQSYALNAIFVEMARRAGVNMGQSLEGMERYMRLALKAQAQSRATIEALDRLANGREQTVRHVHVGNGGQAIVADQIHHHTGGVESDSSDNQPHAKRARGSTLSRAHPIGNTLPISGDTGKATVPNARRQGKRRPEG